MNKIKKILHHVFIDGLSGMATGLFATLIIGTILAQVSEIVPGVWGAGMLAVAGVAKQLMGAGIAVGVAAKYKASPLVSVSAAVAGMAGAYSANILTSLNDGTAFQISGVGEPLGAFIAAFAAIEIGMLVSGRTKLDILLTPAVTIICGCAVGLLLGPPISGFMHWIGNIINKATELQPILMGMAVSAIMGICLTLPISSAAIAVSLGLSGIAGGAACIGCCAHMVGFAVISYRENGFGGLFAQGIGTSMLQVPNLMKKPVLWVPPVVASAMLGPIASALLSMTCEPTGAGMGTSGLVGPIVMYQSMTSGGKSAAVTLAEIAVMCFVLPALLSLAVSTPMRKANIIKNGDLSLDSIN